MKPALLYLLVCLSVTTAAAQRTSITDSLTNRLAFSKADTNRVLLLKTLGQYNHRAFPDKAMQLTEQGLVLARRLKFRRGEAECLLTQSIILEQQGHYPQALERLLLSKKVSETLTDVNLFSRILRAQGKLAASQGDYLQAKLYLFQAKLIQEKLQNKPLLSTTCKVLGELYLEENQLDSAWYYVTKSYQVLGNSNHVASDDLLKDMGQIQARMGNDAQAMAYFRNSIPYSIADNDRTILNEAYLGMARLFLKAGQRDSCIYYSQKGLEAAQKIHYSRGILTSSQLLAEVYEPVNEHQALHYYKLATSIKDSVFNTEKAKQAQNMGFVEQQRLLSLEANRREYSNRIKVYSLLAALGVFLLLALILWRNNGREQKAKRKIETAYEELKVAQNQLIQKEKMASLGELTAGIAHEIQNPLNFVNNLAEVSTELVDELKEEQEKPDPDTELQRELLIDLEESLQKISHHGKRADAIVKGMLQHSRASSGQKELTDLNALAEEYLRVSYHGFRDKDKSFEAELRLHLDPNLGRVAVVPQDIGRVLLNLYNNAFYAVQEKQKQQSNGYKPKIDLTTHGQNGQVELRVKDNGTGIPKELLDKIYQPFFTTKPTGQGTGLGLSLSYDIVTKGHSGQMQVESQEGIGAEFIVQLPV